MQKINKNSFYKPFLILFTGSVLAQVIQLFSYPFLTRLFTPEDFGIKAIFSTILIIISSISTGKYELSILIPKEDNEALLSISASIIISFIVSFLLLVIILLFGNLIAPISFQNEYITVLWLLPIGVFGINVINIILQWVIRKEKYKLLSKVKIIQSLSKASFEITGGFLEFNFIVLIIGLLIGMCGGLFILIRDFINDLKEIKVPIQKVLSKEKFLYIIKKYDNLPKFAILSGLLNRLNHHFPILFFTFYGTLGIVGQYSMALIVISIIYAVLADSFAQIYLSDLSKLIHRGSKEGIKNFFFKTFYRIIILGGIPFLVLIFFGNFILPYMFGEQWELAGRILQILAFYFLSMIIFFLAFHIYNLLEQQRSLLILNFFKFIFLSLGFLISFQWEYSTLVVVTIFVVINLIISAFQLFFAYKKIIN